MRALQRLGEIDRRACRQRVQDCFSIETMVEAYQRVYQTITSAGTPEPARSWRITVHLGGADDRFVSSANLYKVGRPQNAMVRPTK